MTRQIVLLSLAASFLTLNSTVLATDRLLPSQYSTLEVSPNSINYDAEAYAYSWAQTEMTLYEDSDEAEDFSNNSKAMAQAHAYFELLEFYAPGCSYWEYVYSFMNVSGEVVYGSNTVSLTSRFRLSGYWYWDDDCDGEDDGDGGNGSGYTSLAGTIGIDISTTMKVEAAIDGSSPGSWESWDWWLKIWDDDPNYPIALLSDSNMSECFDVLTGQTLNFEFYHEAGKVDLPRTGLESTVVIDLYLLPSADLDQDRDVDFIDYTILASQWKETPGIPSADIAPPCGDDIVDGKDLALLVDRWLWGK